MVTKRKGVYALFLSVRQTSVKATLFAGLSFAVLALPASASAQSKPQEPRNADRSREESVAAMPRKVAFQEIAQRCAPSIHPATLAAVIRHESGANPFAIGINTKGVKLPRQPRTRQEAVATASRLLALGYNFDAGLGQINSANFDWLGLRVPDLFEPCANLKAAATVLGDCYARASKINGEGQVALRAALSCYNTGNFSRGLSNGYVAKVSAHAGVQMDGFRLETVEPSEKSAPEPIQQTLKADADPSARKDAFGNGAADAFSRKPLAQWANEPRAVIQGVAEPIRLTAVISDN